MPVDTSKLQQYGTYRKVAGELTPERLANIKWAIALELAGSLVETPYIIKHYPETGEWTIGKSFLMYKGDSERIWTVDSQGTGHTEGFQNPHTDIERENRESDNRDAQSRHPPHPR